MGRLSGCIMKITLLDHNGVLSDLKPHFELVSSIDEADVVVLWNDLVSFGLSTSRTAHKLGKPVIVIQHGRKAMADYLPPFNRKFTADKACVWGKTDKDELLAVGVPKKKIAITGTTLFNYFTEKTPHKGTNILFSPREWDYDIEENTFMMDLLKKICKKNNWNLMVKINETHDVEKYGDYAILSHRDQADHLDICAKALSQADVLVTMAEYTFELLAQYLDIPVIIAEIVMPRPFRDNNIYIDYAFPRSNATKRVFDINTLEETIKHQLEHPEELKEERRKIVIAEGGTDIEDPLKEIIKVIKNA